MYKTILALIFATLLGSCSIFETAYNEGAKHVSVTWKKDEAKKVIDSLVIHNKSVYTLLNCDTLDYEKEYELNGYNVWILKIGDKIRFEVIRKDSLIYLYGK